MRIDDLVERPQPSWIQSATGATVLLLVCGVASPLFAQNNSKPPVVAPDAEAQRLLAEKEKKLGATFPSKDPAFLVLPRPAYRSTIADELTTVEVRRMNQRALEYLARVQDPDGGWSDTQFPSNTGVTALACLAFMAEGSQPRVGKYGRQLDRGLEFILNNVQSNGVISGKGSNPYGPGYEHAFSTLALLMASGDMPWRPQTRDVISRALQVLLRSQKLDGGWRYQMSRDGLSDLSVTANVLWVLRSAKKAGFTIPRDAIDKGVKYIEDCANPDGTFRYLTGGLHAEPSLGGTGMIALSNHGRLDHPLVAPARQDRLRLSTLHGRRSARPEVLSVRRVLRELGDVPLRRRVLGAVVQEDERTARHDAAKGR